MTSKLELFSEGGLTLVDVKGLILLLLFCIENHSEGMQGNTKNTLTHLEITVPTSALVNCDLGCACLKLK